jgi:2-polyprenyl-6-methoxyphenol hydroxylase-like FAD-dependent oxidoreductase
VQVLAVNVSLSCRQRLASRLEPTLRDAAALRRALAAVNAGEKELLPALAAYERDMIDYGFAAVRTSLADMERFHAEGTLSRMMTKAVFRAVNLMPPLRTAFLTGR